HLDGLAHAALRSFYVPEFADARMVVETGETVSRALAEFGVSDLGPAIAEHEGRELGDAEFLVVGTSEQWLLLRASPDALVRETLKDAIRSYNAANVGTSTVLVYPFVLGSAVETSFLAALRGASSLRVDDEVYALSDLGRRRFYALGEEGLVRGETDVEVRRVGDAFVPLDDPSLSQYHVEVFESEGILRVDFPEAFFELVGAALRATFRYEVAGGVYSLGLNVLPGSDRVTLDGRLLARDVDYVIDYEIGVVSLIVEVPSTGVLVVEYERQSGGLGGAGGYARYFAGTTVLWPVSERLSMDLVLLSALDDAGSISNPEAAKTMPNRQVVAGILADLEMDELLAAFTVGVTDDRFPFDDNERRAVANEINALAVGEGLAIVGHDVGFSVLEEGEWRALTSSHGLAGREVRAAAVDRDVVILGTESGLTVVERVGVVPFDMVANWRRFGERDGLPSASVRSLLLVDGTLWIGTDGGVARVAVEDLADPAAWNVVTDPVVAPGLALASHAGGVYVGTDRGLVRVDGEGAVALDAALGVSALASDGRALYAATERGVQVFIDDQPAGWLSTEAAQAIAVLGGPAYGGTAGYVDPDGVRRHPEARVTAMTSDGENLWIAASIEEGALVLWKVGSQETSFTGEEMETVGWNPYRFEDVIPSEHSTRGWTARASFDHEADGLSLSGEMERTFPGFRGIDVLSRRDEAAWTLEGEAGLGESLRMSFAHAVALDELGSLNRHTTLENRVQLDASPGPRMSLVLVQRAEDDDAAAPGREREEFSYRFGLDHTLFGDALDIGMTWSEAFSWGAARGEDRSTSLGVSATLALGPDASSALAWSRPVRDRGGTRSGSDTLRWSSEAAWVGSTLRLSASYDLSAERALGGSFSQPTHAAEANASVGVLSLGSWKITPTLDLTGDFDAEGLSLGGRLSARTERGGLSGRTILSLDVTGLGERVDRWNERVSSTWTFTESTSFRPTLSYTGTRTVTRTAEEQEATMNHAWSLRVTWTGSDGTSDAFTASLRLQSKLLTAALDNTLSCDVSAWFGGAAADGSSAAPGPTGASLRLLTSGDLRRDDRGVDANWTVGAALDLRLSESWSLSFTSSYLGSLKDSGRAAHAATFDFTAAIDF
ncbi:MAG: hypothetical protein AB1778_09555, partial [Candidatus Bipolaricaulota bacterium]